MIQIKKWIEIETFLENFYSSIIEINDLFLSKKTIDRLSKKSIKIPKEFKKILKVEGE